MRILFVADTPFAPVIAGDAARLSRLIALFKRFGWSVDFACFEEADRVADRAAMARDCDRIEIYQATPQEHMSRCGERLDDWCVPGFAALVRTMVAQRQPHVVWAHFVYHSRVLVGLDGPHHPVTVIDADNVFAGRRNAIERAGIAYDWFSTSAAQELIGLRRADLVVAIHEGEAAHYRSLDPRLVVLVVPYAPELDFLPPVGTKSLGFVGANNAQNRRGLADFLRDAWPQVREAHPDAVLKVAGGVCEAFAGVDLSGVEILGAVDRIADVFADAAIGLNTTTVGTGLKVKSVDVLAHGRPLISTRAGVDGLEGFAHGFRIAESAVEFSRTINDLFADPTALACLTENVRRLAAQRLSVAATFAPIEGALRQRIAAARGALTGRLRP